MKAKIAVGLSPQMRAVKRKISVEQVLAPAQPIKKARIIESGTWTKRKSEKELIRRHGGRHGQIEDNSSKTDIPSDVVNGAQRKSHEKAAESQSPFPTKEPKRKRAKKVYKSAPRELRPRTKKISYKPEKPSKKAKNPVRNEKEEFVILSSTCTKITPEERGPAYFIIPDKKSQLRFENARKCATFTLEDEISVTIFD